VSEPPIILCVDEEPQVLAALSRNLSGRYQVFTAASGPLGLELLRDHPGTIVIISDMHVPGMDGAQFLAATRRVVPHARRILLTGHSEMSTAIAAINEGQICRFLAKPCPPRVLIEAVEFAIADHRTQVLQRQASGRGVPRDAVPRELPDASGVPFDAAVATQQEYRCTVLAALLRAIAEDRLELLYQPIVDARARTIHSIEALARWSDPDLGEVAPANFVPLAESAGLAVPLGDWVLRRACRDAALLVGDELPRVAVNVSVLQLLEPDFLSRVVEILAAHNLPGEALAFEVTESLFVHDLELIASLLAKARQLGIRISIDDFGTGYSSLAFLHRMPTDCVKIDAIFSRDFESGGEAIIRATRAMAAHLGLDAVVEGVETPAMLVQALATGAVLMQGYAIAKPMPVHELIGWRRRFLRGTDAPVERAGDGPRRLLRVVR
jgi:EAL domain-containing protein (putative c-di-GMP-specific phosphodiesterase class I)/CheY-like chemotaxis protein